MKTHVTIKGKEISLVSEDAYTSRFTVNKLLLALDESEPEQKPFSVENQQENEQECWHIEIINGSPYVYSSFFIKDSHIASKLLSTGNYYRTEEEAEAALKRVLQALKS